MLYRRIRIKGRTYFSTVNLAERRSRYLTDYVEVLRTAIETVRTR